MVIVANEEGLTQEEMRELLPLVLAGDQNAFSILYDSYKKAVKLLAYRWRYKVNKASMGLYDLEDMESQFWEEIWLRMSRYEPEKSKFITFIFMLCNRAGDRIWRHYNTQMRNPGDNMTVFSFDISIGEFQTDSMHTLIADPVNAIEDYVNEEELLFQVYLLQKFVSTLSHAHKIVYLHRVKNLTLQASADILGLCRERIRQLRLLLTQRQAAFAEKNHSITHSESYSFAVVLLSDLSDEEVSEQTDYDLASIKICREALQMTSMFNGSGGEFIA